MLNPFTLGEYHATCTAAHPDRPHAVSACVAPSHALAGLPSSCTASVTTDGVYIDLSSEACRRDLRAQQQPHYSQAVPPGQPHFEEARMCATRLGGEFKTFCTSTSEPISATRAFPHNDHPVVTYTDVARRVGGDCEMCCASTMPREPRENRTTTDMQDVRTTHNTHDIETGLDRSTAPPRHAHAGKTRPLYFPFMY
jgi:hypothetical protein